MYRLAEKIKSRNLKWENKKWLKKNLVDMAQH